MNSNAASKINLLILFLCSIIISSCNPELGPKVSKAYKACEKTLYSINQHIKLHEKSIDVLTGNLKLSKPLIDDLNSKLQELTISNKNKGSKIENLEKTIDRL